MKIQVVVINLDRAPERLKRFSEHASKHMIKFERFSAIDKYNIELVNSLRKEYEMHLAPQHSACALSHFKVIENFYESDNDYCVIFEDDAQITDGGFMDIPKLIRDTNVSDPDMIFINDRIGCDANRRIRGGCGLEGYILCKQGAKKILDIKYKVNYPIDFWFMAATQHYASQKNHKWRQNFKVKDTCVHAFKTMKPYTKHVDMKKSYLNGP